MLSRWAAMYGEGRAGDPRSAHPVLFTPGLSASSTPDPASTNGGHIAGAARLLIEEPHRPVWSVDLPRGVDALVGRASGATISLEDRRVSRAHATLTFDGRAVVVRDESSANGTFVGIERIRGARSVGDGATLGIGSSECVVRVKLHDTLQPTREASGDEVVSVDPLSVELFALVRRLAAIDLAVVVEGDPGVGKELVARTLHRHSPRAERPFIAVDCAALTGAFGTEVLFGEEHVAGSGALVTRRGVFEEANGGTVMLGDVAELSSLNQELLVRLLRHRVIVRCRSIRPVRVDVRVVASTRRDLALAVARGRFRQDLYALLRRASLLVPPLRSRPADIPALVERVVRARGGSCQVDPEAMAALLGYPWPGNVRELRRVVEGAIASAGGGAIGVEHLRLRRSGARDALAVDPRRVSTHPARSVETQRRVVAAALEDD